METLYRVPFLVLKCPNLNLKKPPWLHIPLAITMYALVKVSYFLITGGIIYDVIVETPSVGSMTDEHGYQRPVAFLMILGYVTGSESERPLRKSSSVFKMSGGGTGGMATVLIKIVANAKTEKGSTTKEVGMRRIQ
uniref:Oligosaccharyltransferase complex subunit n=1 Tax=Colobus angolensis palliatus TaxID=336983 RepID=A0A2K5HZ52_COLAP